MLPALVGIWARQGDQCRFSKGTFKLDAANYTVTHCIDADMLVHYGLQSRPLLVCTTYLL